MGEVAVQNPAWTPKEDAWLTSFYPRAEWPEMLAALSGRTKKALLNRAHKLGLKREKKDFKPEAPLSRGGPHEIENILPAYSDCNFEERQAKKANEKR